MSRSRVWMFLLVLALLAIQAAADVYHVTLKNGTEIETSRQPQQASWDPNVVLFMTEVGNWVGFTQDEIQGIRIENPVEGYGVQINDRAVALGWSPNDLPEPEKGTNPNDRLNSIAERMLAIAEKQQSYSVDQFVEPGRTQGIPASFGGYSGGTSSGLGSGGLGSGIPLEPSPDRFVESQDRLSPNPNGDQ
jgi:hypothetical protein